jgi:8-oxo-dGTP pyrophosphatase MutT (NUDIX family)
MSLPVITEEYISQRLGESFNTSVDEQPFLPDSTQELRPAAVLIPLFHASEQDRQDHIWQVLFTRRTQAVAEHQGQVSFPGGRSDPGDASPEFTALREAQEEIGLDPARVRILGRMNELRTISNYCVNPVVAVISWPFPIHIEEVEVSRVFSIPLAWLADPAHHEIRDFPIPPPYTELFHQQVHPVIFFETYDNELLWGVSAQITLNFLRILENKKLAGT